MKLAQIRTLTLEVVDCAACGIEFGTPGRFLDERRGDKRTFYCPNGHRMSFEKSTAQRLQEELKQAQDVTARAEARAQRNWELAEAEKRRHAATKGLLTKTQKRIAGGACPCCNRTFVNLGRHMSTKHPDYTQEDPA